MMAPMRGSHVDHKAIRRQHHKTDMYEGKAIQYQNYAPRPREQMSFMFNFIKRTGMNTIRDRQHGLKGKEAFLR